MHLTGEWFESLIKSVNTRATDDERRRVPRIGVRFTADMYQFEGDRLLPPVQVRVRDISPLGIGFTHNHRLHSGQKLIIQLPQIEMEPLRILCEAKNCQVLSEQLFAIGAEFLQIGYKVPPAPPAQPAQTPQPAQSAQSTPPAQPPPPQRRPGQAPAKAASRPAASPGPNAAAPPAAPAVPAARPRPQEEPTPDAMINQMAAQIRRAMFRDG